MTDFEKIKHLLNDLKNCKDTDISKYFSPALDLSVFLTKAERNKCAQSFYQWAEENTEKEPLKFCYAEFLLGENYFFNEDFEATLHLMSKAHKSFEELCDHEGAAICTMGIAATYRTLGNFDLALKMFWEAFATLSRSQKYPTAMLSCANGMANINLETHNYDEALRLFTICYEDSVKANNTYFNIYSLHGLGKVKMLQHSDAEAKVHFENALQLAEKNNAHAMRSSSAAELAKFYCHTGDFAKAEQLNKQALHYREQNNLTGAAITSCINLGELYIKQSKWDAAEQVLNKGLDMAEQIKVKPKMYRIHYLLSEIYKGRNNLEKSMYHFELFHNIQREVEEAASTEKLTNARLIFDAEQTKKENHIIKAQKQEIQKKNAQLQETIDELTITKISRKAKGITLIVGIALIVAEEPITEYLLRHIGAEHFLISLTAKVIVIMSLKPIDRAIEGYLLRRLVLKKRKHHEATSRLQRWSKAVWR